MKKKPKRLTGYARLIIAPDHAAGVMRASLVACDEKLNPKETLEIATLELNLASSETDLFDRWHAIMYEAVTRFLSRSQGIPLEDVEELLTPPHEMN